MSLWSRCSYPVILLCIAALPAAVADGPSGWKIARFTEDARAVYQAASSVTPKTGTDVVVLIDEDNYVFDADGKAVHTSYFVYKVLTQRGAESWDNISINWEPWHEDRPTLRARVITPDSKVHTLDPKTVTDAPASDNEEKIYSDGRVVRAPLPAIAPGSVVEEEYVTRERAPLFDAGVVSREYLGRSVPVQESRLTIDAPASLPLQYSLQLLPDLKPQRSEANGRVHITFEQGPLNAIEEVESYLPNEVPVQARVAFSTGSSWQKVAERYEKTVDEQIVLKDVQSLANGLVSGKSSREGKAASILQYISHEIRYTGIEFGSSAIVPHPLGETLKHKYGDCKDKATLLVAMLRAAGIPSYVALLNAGDRQDVDAGLPGIGLFDHAIVFVPGTPGIWIDATDEYARLGQLPIADQGRLALIAHAETKELVRIPESPSQENRLVEKREFYLAENGPARVVETTEPTGVFEPQYRSTYADEANKDNKKNLTEYVKSQYLAEKLGKTERSDPDDLSKQFRLSVEATKARRGYTELDSATVAIRLESLFYKLPDELQEREKKEEKNDDAAKDNPKKPRTADYQLAEAFVQEWQYKIVPPAGFQPKALPPNAQIALGPANLSEEFSADKDGTVSAVVRFDTTKRRLSVSEAHEMRDKVVQLSEGEALLINFQPVAQALLAQGKIRESFQAYHDLIHLHPNESIHHLQMAKAFLAAGMGEAAREQARMAVNLEPRSAVAQKTLADILEYDRVGRKLRAGSDYAGAAAAFREAKKLDPDDDTISGNLAILLEYDDEGARYGPNAPLKEAVAEYRSLTDEKLAKIGLRNNLAFALYYAGQYEEARRNAEGLNPQPGVLIVAAETAMHGPQAGKAEAAKRASNEAESKGLMMGAGELLLRARRYQDAAVLYEAGASGDNASRTLGLATILKKMQPHETLRMDETPVAPVRQQFLVLLSQKPTLEDFQKLYSANALKTMHDSEKEEFDKLLKSSTSLRRSLSRSGFPADIMIDISMAAVEFASEGDDASGYRVKIKTPGQKDKTQFVVKENGKYLILDGTENANACGYEILDRLRAGNVAGAKLMLDWVRDDEHLAGGDDPLAGEAFPRMWTKGKDASPEQMKLAAATILGQTKSTARDGVSLLEEGRNAAKTDTEKLNLGIALLTAYGALDDYEKSYALASEIAKQYPESKRVFFDEEKALVGLRRFDEADAVAQEMLKRLPDDVEVLRTLTRNAAAREDYARAHELGLKMIAAGKANGGDLNGVAWHTLFTGTTTQEDLDYAVKSTRLDPNNAGHLHTLGCVYAELGKTKEAREVLIQAMDLLNLDEPDANYWYGLGRIAEQYGEIEIAAADYGKAEKPKRVVEIASSSYRLAQMRLQAMKSQGHQAEKAK